MVSEGHEDHQEEVVHMGVPKRVASRAMDNQSALIVSEKHAAFSLDKKYDDDETVGLPNNRHILCQFCEIILIPEGRATKVRMDVDLIQNTQREYERINSYWHVSQLTKFQNIEVHQLDGNLKYLCCLSCQSDILGY
jgi:hypothetical protein